MAVMTRLMCVMFVAVVFALPGSSAGQTLPDDRRATPAPTPSASPLVTAERMKDADSRDGESDPTPEGVPVASPKIKEELLEESNSRSERQQEDSAQQLRREIRAQKAALEEQNRKLEQLLLRLEALERERSAVPAVTAATKPQAQPSQTPAVAIPEDLELVRDSVGDLNTDAVKAGEIPGSILLPLDKGVSLAIGGFIKTLAYYDTKAENRGAVFFPSSLGAARDDRDGGVALTAELTRLNFDARARIGDAALRGYIEFDFAGGNFNWRHGYLTWDDNWGQILAGKYWSNFMDLRAVTEGLGEPTLSGAVFARQAQIRYTRKFSRGLKWTVSVEDPESNDVVARTPILTRTAWPDFITTISADGERSHIQLGALVRRITIDPDNARDFGTTGWGAHLSGFVNLGSRDRVVGAFVYGQGFGRYLLGLLPTSGAFVDIDNRAISSRNALGAVSTIRHRWNPPCRSSAGIGYAAVQNDPLQPDNALRASLFGMMNLLCSVNRYVTIGGEYVYGRRWNKVGALDNNRFMIGVQLF